MTLNFLARWRLKRLYIERVGARAYKQSIEAEDNMLLASAVRYLAELDERIRQLEEPLTTMIVRVIDRKSIEYRQMEAAFKAAAPEAHAKFLEEEAVAKATMHDGPNFPF